MIASRRRIAEDDGWVTASAVNFEVAVDVEDEGAALLVKEAATSDHATSVAANFRAFLAEASIPLPGFFDLAQEELVGDEGAVSGGGGDGADAVVVDAFGLKVRRGAELVGGIRMFDAAAAGGVLAVLLLLLAVARRRRGSARERPLSATSAGSAVSWATNPMGSRLDSRRALKPTPSAAGIADPSSDGRSAFDEWCRGSGGVTLVDSVQTSSHVRADSPCNEHSSSSSSGGGGGGGGDGSSITLSPRSGALGTQSSFV